MDNETSQIISQRFGIEIQRLHREFQSDVADLRESLGAKGYAVSSAIVHETLKLEGKRFGATLNLLMDLYLEYVQDGDELAALDLEAKFDQMYQGATQGATMRISPRHREMLRGDLEEVVKQPLIEALVAAQVRLRTEIHRLRRAPRLVPPSALLATEGRGIRAEESASVPGQDEVIVLRPNLYGLGFDLRALCRRVRNYWRRTDGSGPS